ncbi:MAG: hypothetical protein AUG49_03275 [Catenulispora sp. 13_1_20CM_3_70_7]|nr:MAG: hypothetical protein AUG49_03275 [Catenulispora sp. 13_1_20CM_3_70_7]
MVDMPESRIRDLLAQDLSVLEPGLRLVARERPLKNSSGTRGFIDILARDAHGMFVVIEVKRSNSAAREALHELAKYSELLALEGHAAENVRTIIASTVWDELLAAFSNEVREHRADLRGYQLTVDAEGEGRIMGAERVMPLAASRPFGVSQVHHIFICQTAGERDEVWQRLVTRAKRLGLKDLLAVDFDWHGAPDTVVGLYSLYVAIGVLCAQTDDEWMIEEDVLAELVRDIRTIEQESGYAEKCTAMLLSTSWEPQGFRGTGFFSSDGHFGLSDALRELSGMARGTNQNFYFDTARPAFGRRWNAMVERVVPLVEMCDAWTVLPAWFADTAKAFPDSDVAVTVRNDRDLVMAVYCGWPDRMRSYLPQLHCAVVQNGKRVRTLEGALVWNGYPGSAILCGVEELYGDPGRWGLVGSDPIRDLRLLRRACLRHVLVEMDADGVLSFIAPDGDSFTRTRQGTVPDDAEWRPVASVEDFFTYFRDELRTLYYRLTMPTTA